MMMTSFTMLGLGVAAWFGLKPLAFRVLPDDFAGPDGWYFDSKNRRGIFDWGRRG